ncbi:hypothetical protein MHU86_19829 [Fragilaria crotonensis]|nr:hypothetical protein MHU86_19829 [Fragilaria crotonensis]
MCIVMDEAQLEQEGTPRYPSYSHVLYLHLQTTSQQKQQQESNQTCTLPAPTCIILTDDQADDETTKPTKLVTVPAVVGRLLRFPGNLLHAVPKPYDRWLQQLDGHDVETTFAREEDMEDDDDDDDDESLRSVLLFNTWEERGPLEVGPDSFATESTLEGIEMDEDMMAYLAQEQATRIADWQHDFGGVDFDLLKCNPIEEWVDCHPVALAGADRDVTAMSPVRMSLMRKERGQLNSKQQLSLYGSSSDLRTALEQDRRVSRIQLQSMKK